MAVLLGLLVAATYGSADFFGGLSSKKASASAVVVLSQAMGLPMLAVLVVLAGGHPTPRVLLLGTAAGAVGGIGLLCLYRGLSIGRMSVVAPITAVGAAVVPVAWGLVQRERPGPVASVGVVLAIVAVGLISRTGDEVVDGSHDGLVSARSYLALAVVAGVAFGAVFVLLAETGDDAGFWPLVAGRVASITLLGVGGLATRQSFAAGGRSALAPIAAAGNLDMIANALYLLAARRGLLALVAVLSSLYPASTVLLARVALKERLIPVQLVGLGLAATGVVMIATG
ncbi:MAG TPA: EamA family transporter [Acidimicrobiales bacterium]|nr:EamA family transporter [Acidimicrobiales bacterium]